MNSLPILINWCVFRFVTCCGNLFRAQNTTCTSGKALFEITEITLLLQQQLSMDQRCRLLLHCVSREQHHTEEMFRIANSGSIPSYRLHQASLDLQLLRFLDLF
mmetsp:Transcript_10058/g.14931  ORF Transcript_10058/g.14931 Transcript_10058/m.14931 type:complete len:104 (+) Transcript_10058:13-324(+)